MDDYMFRHFVEECRVVDEATSYMEILNYSVRQCAAYTSRMNFPLPNSLLPSSFTRNPHPLSPFSVNSLRASHTEKRKGKKRGKGKKKEGKRKAEEK